MQPVAVIVSAGFAGHEDDPVSGLKMTHDGFRRMTRAIIQASDAWAEGRIFSVLEGGYDLDALASSAKAHVEVLAGASTVNWTSNVQLRNQRAPPKTSRGRDSVSGSNQVQVQVQNQRQEPQRRRPGQTCRYLGH